MKQLAIPTLIALLVVVSPARGLVDPNAGLGEPAGFDPSDTFVVRRPQYVVAVSKKHGGPAWASWHLDLGDLGQAPRHTGGFLVDGSLPVGWYRATDRDYVRSGFDRGHLVDSADRTSSVDNNTATFFLSNVSPQAKELNRGPWEGLEGECRKQARSGNDVYVVAGPQWGTNPQHLGAIEVAASFWKVAVVVPHGGRAADVTAATTVLVAVMPNDATAKGNRWTTYRTSLDSAQKACSCSILTAVAPGVKAALLRK